MSARKILTIALVLSAPAFWIWLLSVTATVHSGAWDFGIYIYALIGYIALTIYSFMKAWP